MIQLSSSLGFSYFSGYYSFSSTTGGGILFTVISPTFLNFFNCSLSDNFLPLTRSYQPSGQLSMNYFHSITPSLSFTSFVSNYDNKSNLTYFNTREPILTSVFVWTSFSSRFFFERLLFLEGVFFFSSYSSCLRIYWLFLKKFTILSTNSELLEGVALETYLISSKFQY